MWLCLIGLSSQLLSKAAPWLFSDSAFLLPCYRPSQVLYSLTNKSNTLTEGPPTPRADESSPRTLSFGCYHLLVLECYNLEDYIHPINQQKPRGKEILLLTKICQCNIQVTLHLPPRFPHSSGIQKGVPQASKVIEVTAI